MTIMLDSCRRFAVLYAVIAYVLLACLQVPHVSAETASGERDALRPTEDFTKAEPGERLSGGAATSLHAPGGDSFSHASANLSFEQEMLFKVGNGFFKRIWVTSPASTKAADGLGPLYNARSCQRCHLKDGRGHPPKNEKDSRVSMFLRLSIPPQTEAQKKAIADGKMDVVPEPTYGGQFQDHAIKGLKPEGRMAISYTEKTITLSDGTDVSLRVPTYAAEDLNYGPLHKEALLSPRVAPQMIGLGLLQAIPEELIRAAADPEDKDGDGISGRSRDVWSKEHERIMLGRFGWKAGNPTVRQQSDGAFAGDIGISTPLNPFPSGDCTAAQKACLEAPHGNSPEHDNLEASEKVMQMVAFYSQNLAVPARRSVNDATVLKGKEIFYASGCTSCHTPKYRTGQDPEQPHLSNQLIWPYTDMLLHDMGEGLADGRPEGTATGREWRTAPLWGIGLTETVNGHTFFLHDGRARNLLEAILWHGGEAEAAKQAVVALEKGDRDALLAFLNSL